MPSPELRRLHKLHLIDRALVEVRKRAAALDPGKALAKEVHDLEAKLNGSPAKVLQSELTDLELRQKGFQEKIQKFEKELYGGKVVNPREVEALQKEIASLKRQRGDLDGRILEIWDELPKAKSESEGLEQNLAERKQALSAAQKKALAEKQTLESEFKQLSAQRPNAAKEVPPTLLARYEGIRQKHGGIAIGEVDVKTGTCGACGTKLPTRTIEALKEEKTVTCESCHRILYYSTGVV